LVVGEGERERQRGEYFSSFSVSAVSLLLLLLAESTILQASFSVTRQRLCGEERWWHHALSKISKTPFFAHP
jgi:hypothetical protein